MKKYLSFIFLYCVILSCDSLNDGTAPNVLARITVDGSLESRSVNISHSSDWDSEVNSSIPFREKIYGKGPLQYRTEIGLPHFGNHQGKLGKRDNNGSDVRTNILKPDSVSC